MQGYFQKHLNLLCFCTGAAPIAWEGVLRLICCLPGSYPGFSIWGILTGAINLVVLSLLLFCVTHIKGGSFQRYFPILAAGWLIPYTIVAFIISFVVDFGLGEWAVSNGIHKIAWTMPFSWYVQGQLWTAFPLGIIGLMCAAWYTRNANKDWN